MRPAGHDQPELAAALGAARVAFGACRAPDDNAKTVNRYLELVAQGKADDIAELYADDAHRRGSRSAARCTSAVRRSTASTTRFRRISAKAEVVTLRALGNEAAFFWALTIDLGGNRMRIEIISVMTFDEERQDHLDEGLLGPGERHPSSE